MALKEYKPPQAFPGVIGRTFDVSKPAWPAPNRAKEGAPVIGTVYFAFSLGRFRRAIFEA